MVGFQPLNRSKQKHVKCFPTQQPCMRSHGGGFSRGNEPFLIPCISRIDHNSGCPAPRLPYNQRAEGSVSFLHCWARPLGKKWAPCMAKHGPNNGTLSKGRLSVQSNISNKTLCIFTAASCFSGPNNTAK